MLRGLINDNEEIGECAHAALCSRHAGLPGVYEGNDPLQPLGCKGWLIK